MPRPRRALGRKDPSPAPWWCPVGEGGPRRRAWTPQGPQTSSCPTALPGASEKKARDSAACPLLPPSQLLGKSLTLLTSAR